MRTNPEPHEPVRRFDRKGAVVTAHPSGPESSDFFEVKRRVTWVLLQVRVGLIGKLLDVLR